MQDNSKKLDLDYFISNLGCSKNLVDSEMLIYALDQQGMNRVNDPADAEVIVINTCGFIEAAQQESINAILEAEKFKKEGRCKCLAVTGCLSQRFGSELFSSLPEIDIILGTGNFLQLPGLLRKNQIGSDRLLEPGTPGYSYPDPGRRKLLTSGHSAYLKIAEGCSNHCSYCIIPAMRGSFRSRLKKTILAEAEILVNEGVKEINLIAQETSAYGLDLPPDNGDLANLLEEVADIRGVHWVRFLYTHPERITNRLLEVIKSNCSICRYLDIPLQHVDENILKKMNRKGSPESLYELICQIRDFCSDISLRTTFLVGFPGETAREFEKLMHFIERAQFDWVGFFPFSPQEGTPAAKLKPVSRKETNRRIEELTQLQLAITENRIRRWIDRTVQVLVEGKPEDCRELFIGRTEGQAPEVDGTVLVKGAGEQDIGQFINVKITGVENYDLVGEVAHEYSQ